MTKHALVIKADLTTQLIDIAEQELSKLQAAVDGLIQPVDLSPEITMWVNEEGLLRDDLLPNPLGSAFMAEVFNSETVIMGDIVFTGGVDEDGNTTSLSKGDVDKISNIVRSATDAVTNR